MTAPFEEHCMAYEECIREAFDDCERYGDPAQLANADVYAQGDWPLVARGLSSALEQHRARASGKGSAYESCVKRAIKALAAPQKDNAHFIAALIFTIRALAKP